jgi:4-alpha-glucanotransferase
LRAGFDYFCAQNASWLDDFALFMALKEANGGGAWNGWNEALRSRKKSALTKARKQLSEDIQRHSFYQFLVLPSVGESPQVCQREGNPDRRRYSHLRRV